jgi:hypothetical protein
MCYTERRKSWKGVKEFAVSVTAEEGVEKRIKQKRSSLTSNSLYEKQFLNVGLSKEFQSQLVKQRSKDSKSPWSHFS